jgi:hypothetical protein
LDGPLQNGLVSDAFFGGDPLGAFEVGYRQPD